MKRFTILFSIIMMMHSTVFSQDSTTIQLPIPKMHGGDSIMNCLKKRSSNRDFSDKMLPLQMLSDLLWAANGINRPEIGKRTAPTARNWQDIEIYVIMHSGIYLWQDSLFQLKLTKSGDYMKETGKQFFVEDAPLNIIIVSDTSKMIDAAKENIPIYAGMHAGYISQNIYLYCASFGLNTVARRALDINALAKIMNLPANKWIVLAQTVGYPVEK